MTGSCLVVANVQHSRFAQLVDPIREPFNIDHTAILIPDQALAVPCPYLAWRGPASARVGGAGLTLLRPACLAA